LQLYYPFAEGAGTTIYDVSGNANHGTAQNITEADFWANTTNKVGYPLANSYGQVARFNDDAFIDTGITQDFTQLTVASWVFVDEGELQNTADNYFGYVPVNCFYTVYMNS
jgi:uncharacterized protein YukJ